MTDLPQPVNKTAQTVDDIIHEALYGVAAVAFEKWAETQLVILDEPGFKQLFEGVVSLLMGQFYKFISQAATFTVIDLQVDQERDAYAKAEGALRAAHLSGDPNALAKATIDFKTALARVIHFDGTAS